MSAISRAQEVLQIWFGCKPYTAAQVTQRSRLWFGDPSAPELGVGGQSAPPFGFDPAARSISA
jgi:hypothetical protein